METSELFVISCCDEENEKAIERELIVAEYLRHAYNVEARICSRPGRTVPSRDAVFRRAPYVAEPPKDRKARLLLIDGHRLNDKRIVELESLFGGCVDTAHLCGVFDTEQSWISKRNHLLFSLNILPEAIDQSLTVGMARAPGSGLPFVFPFKREIARHAAYLNGPRRLPVIVHPDPDKESAEALAMASELSNLAISSGREIWIITNGKSKAEIVKASFSGLRAFNYSEFALTHFPKRPHAFFDFRSNQSSDLCVAYRMASFSQGGIVLDCGDKPLQHPDLVQFIEGPKAVSFVRSALETLERDVHSFIRSFDDLRATIFTGEVVEADPIDTAPPPDAAAPKRLLRRRGEVEETRTAAPLPTPTHAPQHSAAVDILFYPTNGSGLGHAQRCVSIARGLPPGPRVGFALHSSCLGLAADAGQRVTPLVSRSPRHVESWANDLVNFMRLKQFCSSETTLVFDGGYVFDSVCQLKRSLNLRNIWMRRELFREDQDNSVPFDREKYFDRVIVPTECFTELNHRRSSFSLSNDRFEEHVGPVVSTSIKDAVKKRAAIRKDLFRMFGKKANRIIVSLLGGGVASDREAHLNIIASYLEGQEDVLHIVVRWPNSVFSAHLNAFTQTKQVWTNRAYNLAAAADMVISAGGYNSVHEMTYAQVPVYYLPQSASWLDDQLKRVQAAEKREIARVFEEHETRKLLEALAPDQIQKFRTKAEAAFRDLALPETGNQRAAEIIAGV